MANLGKKALAIVAIPLARNNLPGLVSNLASNAINKFERKVSWKGAVRAGIWKKSKLNCETVRAGMKKKNVTETVKHEIKK